jgi:hypothetical protein
MFAGTESSTSVPTPARLRIFSLAAYTHRSPNGNVLEAGVWFATELVKFDSYGAAAGAMPRLGFALGPAPLGPKRFSTSPMPHRSFEEIQSPARARV